MVESTNELVQQIKEAVAGHGTGRTTQELVKEIRDAVVNGSIGEGDARELIDEIVDGAPEEFDTLKEIADFLDTVYTKTEVDTAISNKATASALTAETSARQAADTALQNGIDAEASARQTADTTLQGGIDAEASARAAADTAMNTRISALEDATPSFTSTAKLALLNCLQHVAWIDTEGWVYYQALENELRFDEIVSISATFTQGQRVFSNTDKLDDLIPFLSVEAVYGDQTRSPLMYYQLSGTLTPGTAIITVTYETLTTTFAVNVSTVPSGYTVKNYVISDQSQYILTQIVESSVANCWFRLKERRTGYENRNGHIFSSSAFYTPYLFAFGQFEDNFINANRFGNEMNKGLGVFSSNVWQTDVDYVIESYKDGNNIYLNDVWYGSLPAGNTISDVHTFCLLGYRGSDGTVAERFRFIGRFYYLKVFNSNNEKVHDFVPCANSSNVIGIYDLVDGIFYAPTAGTLIAG